MLNYFQIVGYSFLAVSFISFALNSPLKTIPVTGLVGAIGYTVHFFCNAQWGNEVVSVFLGSCTVGLLSEIFARILRAPATLFLICGILPLVPGHALYGTMYELIKSNRQLAVGYLFNSILLAGAIGGGVSLVSTFFKVTDQKF